jgi:hypothetical protein
MVQHEALLALLGHPGVLVARGKDGAFAVGECVDFLAVHEKALLQRIAAAGETYVALDAFVRCVQTARRSLTASTCAPSAPGSTR